MPELATIPSRTIKIFKDRILILVIPGQKAKENYIHRANYFFEKKKTKKTKQTIGHIKMIKIYFHPIKKHWYKAVV